MSLLDLLETDCIELDLKAKTKNVILKEMTRLIARTGRILDSEKVLEDILAREEQISTGIGQGIAIPHARSTGVDKIAAGLGISKKGVDFKAVDGQAVYIIFLLVVPENLTDSGINIKILAKISRLLKNEYLRNQLRQAKDKDEILNLIRDGERGL